jgi:hypothetical protein
MSEKKSATDNASATKPAVPTKPIIKLAGQTGQGGAAASCPTQIMPAAPKRAQIGQ